MSGTSATGAEGEGKKSAPAEAGAIEVVADADALVDLVAGWGPWEPLGQTLAAFRRTPGFWLALASAQTLPFVAAQALPHQTWILWTLPLMPLISTLAIDASSRALVGRPEPPVLSLPGALFRNFLGLTHVLLAAGLWFTMSVFTLPMVVALAAVAGVEFLGPTVGVELAPWLVGVPVALGLTAWFLRSLVALFLSVPAVCLGEGGEAAYRRCFLIARHGSLARFLPMLPVLALTGAAVLLAGWLASPLGLAALFPIFAAVNLGLSVWTLSYLRELNLWLGTLTPRRDQLTDRDLGDARPAIAARQ